MKAQQLFVEFNNKFHNNDISKWQILSQKIEKMELTVHRNMKYPKQEDMARVSIHGISLKEKRLETEDHSEIQTFFIKNVGRLPPGSVEILTRIKSIISNPLISVAAIVQKL